MFDAGVMRWLLVIINNPRHPDFLKIYFLTFWESNLGKSVREKMKGKPFIGL